MRGLPHAIVLVLAGGLAAAAQAPDEPGPAPDPLLIRFVAGDDAGPATLSAYVPRYVIAPAGTSIAVELRGVAGATLRIDSLFKLQNTA